MTLPNIGDEPVVVATEDFTWFGDWYRALVAHVGRVVKGKDDEIGLVVLAMFAGGHVLIEDNPGTGKTTLARSLARSIKGNFERIQFTPDLLPSDVTGGRIFDQKQADFTFHPGPIFANVVLADEINRASPKTQSALLQAMEEAEVTIERTTHTLDAPFMVIATQNPIEQAGTYRLPEAQLDRFMIKLRLDYPDAHDEQEMLDAATRGVSPDGLSDIIAAEEVAQMGAALARVHVNAVIQRYIISLCEHTRHGDDRVLLGVSPRGAIALMRLCRAKAASQGRDYVNVDDVVHLAPYVMSHRIVLTPEAELGSDLTPARVVEDAIAAVEQPLPLRS